ncbi:hypothetical protein A3A21_02595 [Candidatus Jorgensenbacteria bacterium RIFCSPLOWO2_01_FULL_45_25b]|uniref:Uncharacterized protein n=1 Tax=Candidatus Jorgensenbacteria bacterium RIFCSPLOWO2_01_FULL_45_25b TaxID=1798471 RepID=A0A1F6BZR2_9BACT|nr:MAG: hypothetical protein A3A21_02595 [Candidatus Jorgensenbacteria bacterium RIFCSPLOWO2_01_FULL_45_25b]
MFFSCVLCFICLTFRLLVFFFFSTLLLAGTISKPLFYCNLLLHIKIFYFESLSSVLFKTLPRYTVARTTARVITIA